jgi:hypothetical protein
MRPVADWGSPLSAVRPPSFDPEDLIVSGDLSDAARARRADNLRVALATPSRARR